MVGEQRLLRVEGESDARMGSIIRVSEHSPGDPDTVDPVSTGHSSVDRG